MKRLISIITVTVLIASILLSMTSCSHPNRDDDSNERTEHRHKYVDGRCSCGGVDPDYNIPHTHHFVDGICTCGEIDSNYTPPHVHNFINGICECGMRDQHVGEDTNDTPTADVFSVQLLLDGCRFSPNQEIEVVWHGRGNSYVATVDENGYAYMNGLDGEYTVSLRGLPQEFAYYPHLCVSSNDNRNIDIPIYTAEVVSKSSEPYAGYIISKPGVYTVTVDGPDEFNHISFLPSCNGVYTIESWVDIGENNINPICKAYLGSSQYLYGEYIVDDYGICGSFTKNFIHTICIADEDIITGRSLNSVFAIGAETRDGEYPVKVTFVVKRNSSYEISRDPIISIIPSHDWSSFDFDHFNSLAGGNLVGAETLAPGSTDSYIFNQSNYRLWRTEEGGDGVYHVYDEEKYPETNGYGPILVVYITTECRYLDRSFTTIEDIGNNALVVNGTDNYRLMIKGIEEMAEQGYFCIDKCLCHVDGSMRACLKGCPVCCSDCTQVTEEELNTYGYASIVNGDGVAPVTPEIVAFLQGFAITQRYFADGDGWVEKNSKYPIDAYEDSQWLFACAYYEE